MLQDIQIGRGYINNFALLVEGQKLLLNPLRESIINNCFELGLYIVYFLSVLYYPIQFKLHVNIILHTEARTSSSIYSTSLELSHFSSQT